jgi:roadblock/LC7 domain-containing protein
MPKWSNTAKSWLSEQLRELEYEDSELKQLKAKIDSWADTVGNVTATKTWMYRGGKWAVQIEGGTVVKITQKT